MYREPTAAEQAAARRHVLRDLCLFTVYVAALRAAPAMLHWLGITADTAAPAS